MIAVPRWRLISIRTRAKILAEYISDEVFDRGLKTIANSIADELDEIFEQDEKEWEIWLRRIPGGQK